MKKIYASKIIVLLLVSVIVLAFSPKNDENVGKVTFPLGNVLVLKKGETRFGKATFNMPVYNGDKIETKKTSRCEITFKDGSLVRIDEQSIYTVEKAQITEEKKEVESTLFFGKLWANVKKLVTGKDSWRLKSPTAVVAVRGTIYRMNAGADSSTQVLVYDGNVAVSPAGKGDDQKKMGLKPGQPKQIKAPVQIAPPKEVSLGEWIEIVKAQQQIVIKPDGSYVKSEFSLEEDSKLDWVQWNKERDKLLEQ